MPRARGAQARRRPAPSRAASSPALYADDDDGLPAIDDGQPQGPGRRDRRHRRRLRQRPAELVEVLAGQRPPTDGGIVIHGERVRADARPRCDALQGASACPRSRCSNACVPRDERGREHRLPRLRQAADRHARLVAVARRRCASKARELIAALRRQDAVAGRADRRRCPAATCSARCWRASCRGEVDVLIVANPCFGLDFAAVAEIRAQIMRAAQPRRRGAAGQRGPRRDPGAGRPHRGDVRRHASSTRRRSADADRHTIGQHMAGH